MKGKLIFVTGLAVGYVLGTRDGRRRYEQIKSAAQNIWESEPIQWAASQAQGAMGELGDIALTGARKIVHQATKPNIEKPAASPNRTRSTTTKPRTKSTSAAPVTKPVPTVEPSARPRKTDAAAE